MRAATFALVLAAALGAAGCASGGLFGNSADIATRVSGSGTFTVVTLDGPTVEGSVERRSGRRVRHFRVTGESGRLDFRVLPAGQLEIDTSGSTLRFGGSLMDGWEIDLEASGTEVLLPQRDRRNITVRDTGTGNILTWR